MIWSRDKRSICETRGESAEDRGLGWGKYGFKPFGLRGLTTFGVASTLSASGEGDRGESEKSDESELWAGENGLSLKSGLEGLWRPTKSRSSRMTPFLETYRRYEYCLYMKWYRRQNALCINWRADPEGFIDIGKSEIRKKKAPQLFVIGTLAVAFHFAPGSC